MIELLRPDGTVECRDAISFKEIQHEVGGFVEMVTIDGGKTQCCCNEDGLAMGLPVNNLAMARFRGKINMAPAVGTWVVLTGKDLLT